jgi:hypothetical protein
MAVELSGRGAGDVRDVVGVGHRYPGEGFAPEQSPPAFDEDEPGGTNRNEGVLDARVARQPVPDRTTQVTGQIVGDEVQIAVGESLRERLQQRQIPSRVACGRSLGQRLPVADRQRALDPDRVGSPLIVHGHIDAVPVW